MFCLGHDSGASGGVLVVSVVNGTLRGVCSAKVRRLGEQVGQSWRLHVHPQDSTKATYVCNNGEVKWNLSEIEVLTVEHCAQEHAIEFKDIRELGMWWTWFINDCVLSCLLGKTWNWRPHSLKNQCRKLMLMCLWNLTL